MKKYDRIDKTGKKRRLIKLEENDFRLLKHEYSIDREYVIAVWLPANTFESGDIIINHRTRDEGPRSGRFELVKIVEKKVLRRSTRDFRAEKWTTRKWIERLYQENGKGESAA